METGEEVRAGVSKGVKTRVPSKSSREHGISVWTDHQSHTALPSLYAVQRGAEHRGGGQLSWLSARAPAQRTRTQKPSGQRLPAPLQRCCLRPPHVPQSQTRWGLSAGWVETTANLHGLLSPFPLKLRKLAISSGTYLSSLQGTPARTGGR